MTREFKVGDKVFDIRHGNGEVIDISKSLYPILCRFEVESSDYYTADGRSLELHKTPLLYHGHDLVIEVKEPEYEYVIAFLSDITNYWETSSTYYKSIEDFTHRRPLAEFPTLLEPSKRLVKRG